MYKTPWEEKEIRIFWSVINSIQRLILYLHRNDDVLNKWQLLDWKQNAEIPVDQMKQNTKNEWFQHKINHR